MSRIHVDLSCFPEGHIESLISNFKLVNILADCRLNLITYFNKMIIHRHGIGEVDSPVLMTSAYMLGILTKDANPATAANCFRYAMGPKESEWEPLAMNEYARLLYMYPSLRNEKCTLEVIAQLFERAAFAGIAEAKDNLSIVTQAISNIQAAPQAAPTLFDSYIKGLPTIDPDIIRRVLANS